LVYRPSLKTGILYGKALLGVDASMLVAKQTFECLNHDESCCVYGELYDGIVVVVVVIIIIFIIIIIMTIMKCFF